LFMEALERPDCVATSWKTVMNAFRSAGYTFAAQGAADVPVEVAALACGVLRSQLPESMKKKNTRMRRERNTSI
jgi:hypothetical protein